MDGGVCARVASRGGETGAGPEKRLCRVRGCVRCRARDDLWSARCVWGCGGRGGRRRGGRGWRWKGRRDIGRGSSEDRQQLRGPAQAGRQASRSTLLLPCHAPPPCDSALSLALALCAQHRSVPCIQHTDIATLAAAALQFFLAVSVREQRQSVLLHRPFWPCPILLILSYLRRFCVRRPIRRQLDRICPVRDWPLSVSASLRFASCLAA